MAWKLTAKGMTGASVIVEISRPQDIKISEVKLLVAEKNPNAPHYLQRLLDSSSGMQQELEDDRKLSDYPTIKNGATLFVLVKPPWNVYVYDMDNKKHEVAVPSSTPELFTLRELRVHLASSIIRKSLEGYKLHLEDKELEETRSGRNLTLQDLAIRKESTLFVRKFVPKVVNPKVDIAFLVDCTGSMGSYIESVKNNVKGMCDEIKAKFTNCDLRFSFVRYTDYDQPASTRTTWIDFTTSTTQFRSFVDGIKADGGGDGPEDVMGGMKVVFTNLCWRSGVTRVIIHIADAPCHGIQYHGGGGDTYPNGDPAGISHEQMMRQIVESKVYYWFGYISQSSTDKMISVFNQSLRSLSGGTRMISQFDATKPGNVADVPRHVRAEVFASAAM